MDNPYNNPYVLPSRLRTTGMEATATTTVDMDLSRATARRAIITVPTSKATDIMGTTVMPIGIQLGTTRWTAVPV